MIELPRLHLVTDGGTALDADFPARAERVLQRTGSAAALHLRAPGMNGRRLHERAVVLREICGRAGALFFVNDRVDIVLAAGAAGVQLGARSIPVEAVRRWVGEGMVIGASVHSRGESEQAVAAGADFLLVGTIHATPSHPGREGRGIGAIEELLDLGVPLVGIGGITPERAARLRAAGAHGAAVLRGVWAAADPEGAAGAYMEALEGEGDG